MNITQNWQPITEDAPKHEELVLLYCQPKQENECGPAVFSGYWDDESLCWYVPQTDSEDGAWCNFFCWDPTHFMTLPPAPEAA